ncbi:MAG: DUF192 domain-containing protein [Anaerolineae bacterium]|nr:DUF192 domain-containing protein [Anaerolineae bacterium]
MNDWRVIRKASPGEASASEVSRQSNQIVLARAKWCKSLWCQFKGLQMRRSLPEDEGLLFDFRRESVVATSIHMFFVFFAIAAVWLDAEGRVVDAKLAKPWRPAYAPAKPARYLIEARPSLLDRVQIGDHLTFDEAAQ